VNISRNDILWCSIRKDKTCSEYADCMMINDIVIECRVALGKKD
jgi:hypothetical protein